MKLYSLNRSRLFEIIASLPQVPFQFAHVGELFVDVYLSDSHALTIQANFSHSISLIRPEVGQKFKLTKSGLRTISDSCRSIHAYPSQNFVDKISDYVGQIGIASHTFPPGFDITLQFSDGQSFHAKTHWLEFA